MQKDIFVNYFCNKQSTNSAPVYSGISWGKQPSHKISKAYFLVWSPENLPVSNEVGYNKNCNIYNLGTT